MKSEPNRSEPNVSRTLGLGYFNLARGLGMVLIVLGHSINLYLDPLPTGNGGFFSGAGSVFGGGIMAAFFMISGYGFYKRKPRKCFAIQRKLLLLPYCIVAAAVIISKFLLAVVRQRSFMENGGEFILTYLLGLNAEGGGTLWGIPVESVSIFWFVLALFGGWLIYNGIVQITSDRLRVLLTASCVILGYVLTLISKIWPCCLPMALIAVGYLHAGAELKERGLLEKEISWKWWGIILALILFSAAFGQVSIVACMWKLGLADVLATFCTGFLFLRIYAAYMRREHTGRLMSVLEEIGFNSIWIVCLHAYEKVIFPWYRLTDAMAFCPAAGVLVCFAARCIVMYIMYRSVMFLHRKLQRKKRGKFVLD